MAIRFFSRAQALVYSTYRTAAAARRLPMSSAGSCRWWPSMQPESAAHVKAGKLRVLAVLARTGRPFIRTRRRCRVGLFPALRHQSGMASSRRPARQSDRDPSARRSCRRPEAKEVQNDLPMLVARCCPAARAVRRPDSQRTPAYAKLIARSEYQTGLSACATRINPADQQETT